MECSGKAMSQDFMKSAEFHIKYARFHERPIARNGRAYVYFCLYTFHKIDNMWKWKIYVKILNCGFGSELNASCNNVKNVATGEILFPGKLTNIYRFFVQMLLHQSAHFLHCYKMHLVLIRIHSLKF